MKDKYLFTFKKFKIRHQINAHKVGTDSMLLGSWTIYDEAKTILDIGTGSGLLALMAAQKTIDDVKITAIEIEESFCGEAQENFNNSPWQNKIELVNKDINNFTDKTFDLIICNPPYFENQLLSPLTKKNSARHTIHLSLKKLPSLAHRLLNKNGTFNIVLPIEIFKESFQNECEKNNLFIRRICKVKHNSKRDYALVLIELSKMKNENIVEESLIINIGENKFSEEYIQLLRDFLIIL